jgi:hypothetical protein
MDKSRLAAVWLDPHVSSRPCSVSALVDICICETRSKKRASRVLIFRVFRFSSGKLAMDRRRSADTEERWSNDGFFEQQAERSREQGRRHEPRNDRRAQQNEVRSPVREHLT